MNDLDRVIHLHRQFKKFDKYKYSELAKMLMPSINLDQYQIHKLGHEDIGFTNWAYLSDNVEQRFEISCRLKANEWNCGDNIWVIQVLAKSNVKQIMKWVIDYFREKINVNQSVKWIRADDNFNIYRRSQKFKREFHLCHHQ